MLDKGKLTDEPFTCVSLVSPEFIQHRRPGRPATAAMGQAVPESVHDITEEASVKLIRQMVEFARQSEQTGQPVLELVVM